MDEKQRAQACLAALLFMPIIAWLATAKLVYGFTPSNIRAQLLHLMRYTFDLWPLSLALIVGGLLGVVTCVVIIKLSKRVFAGANYREYYRGSVLSTQQALARKTQERGLQITIAGIPVPRKSETTHFSIGGSTGTGKTTIFKEMMLGCMQRKDRMVVLDPDGEFLSTFYRKGDRILNPFDARTEGWSFFNEIRDDYDFERIAKSIIQKSSSHDSEEWNRYGRLLFHEVARKLYNTTRNPNIQDVFQWTNQKPMKELEAFVRGTAAMAIFTENVKASSSVRFVLSEKIPPHLKMPLGKFSLRDWLEDPNEGNLFITWDENMREALKPIISCWVDTIFSSVLGMSNSRTRRVWTFLDELESLQHLPTLGTALTRGRKKGLCIVSGYQSYAQLIDVYGEQLAETMLGNHRSMVALAIGRMGVGTAEKLSKALGEHEVARMKEGHSTRWGQFSTKSENEDIRPERIVMPSEIYTLNDLEGFLSFPGNLPIARFEIKPITFTRNMPVEGIIPFTNSLVNT